MKLHFLLSNSLKSAGFFIMLFPVISNTTWNQVCTSKKRKRLRAWVYIQYNGKYRSLPDSFTFKQSVCIDKTRASLDTGLPLSTRVFPTEYYSQVILCHTRIVNTYWKTVIDATGLSVSGPSSPLEHYVLSMSVRISARVLVFARFRVSRI